MELQILSCGPYGEITLCKVLHIYQARSAGNAKLVAKENFALQSCLFKVNSVQEAYTKCLAVHKLKFEILQSPWKNKTLTSKC